MIVSMKKLTLLCLDAERNRTLRVLRDLGVVHVAPMTPPEGQDLEDARKLLDHVRRALDVLPAKTDAPPSGKSTEHIVGHIWDLVHERKDLEEKLETLRYRRRTLEPFGEFDPAGIERLAEAGLKVKLYEAGIDADLNPPEDALFTEFSRDKEHIWFAVVGQGEWTMEQAREIAPPECALSELDRRLAEAEQGLAKNAEWFEKHAGDRDAVASIVNEVHDDVTFFEARDSMGQKGKIAWLQGYCPAESEDALKEAAADQGWGLVVEEPDDADAVPTLIRNPAWVRPIKAVFEMIGVVPGYEEVDISALFLIFLSLFFGMLVGDAGYGALFLGLTLFAKFKFKSAPAPLLNLMLITSTATIIWGALTGNYFGTDWVPGPLQAFHIDWLSTTNPDSGNHIMFLCFLIGAIHLTIAHGWNFVRMMPSPLAWAQLGWCGTTWTMFFAARAMVLGKSFPPFMYGVLILGILLIVLFMTPFKKIKSEWFNFVMFPLDLISNFVDVVSYVRLFAVGTASYAVAHAFNGMAVGNGINSIWAGLGAAVILLLGHTLNILLALMGVLVHGIRLNTLEFAGHVGMQWTGRAYKPFTQQKEN